MRCALSCTLAGGAGRCFDEISEVFLTFFLFFYIFSRRLVASSKARAALKKSSVKVAGTWMAACQNACVLDVRDICVAPRFASCHEEILRQTQTRAFLQQLCFRATRSRCHGNLENLGVLRGGANRSHCVHTGQSSIFAQQPALSTCPITRWPPSSPQLPADKLLR